MRQKTIMRFIGTVFLALGLAGLATASNHGLFFSSWSYNFYLLTFGVLALGASDVGGEQAKLFDYGFMLVLLAVAIAGLATLVRHTEDLPNQTIVVVTNAAALVALIYSRFIYKPTTK